MTVCLTSPKFEAFLAGSLLPEEQSQAEAHLAICAQCRKDLDLLRTNRRLISETRHDYQDDTVTASGHPLPEVSWDTPPRFPGTGSIEGYEILCEIHRGGQGVVYKAVQKATKRLIALKVLLAGPHASSRQRRRFEREVDLVASLRHPHIVTIYDSGVTHDGHHYFAMEYVHGQSLDAYVSTVNLSIDEKLLLFRKVCLAVGHAHLHGVIHRDLKPSNIRVDAAGEPHLLDFGLAKAAGSDLLGEGPLVTMTGEFMGTLAYASPEQTTGDPSLIDVRTDVYSLGVMLYEMITGQLPYRVKGRLDEVLKTIHQVEPKRPSRVNPKINDELEMIVLKAIEKEPERRYHNATAMADDIQRYLSGEAIEAKRASSMYMLKKSLRHHRKHVAAMVLLTIGLSFTAGLSWSIVRKYRNGLKAQVLVRHAAQWIQQRTNLSLARLDLTDAIELDPHGSDEYLHLGLLNEIEGLDAPLIDKKAFARHAKDAFEQAHFNAGGHWLPKLGEPDTRSRTGISEPGSKTAVLAAAQLLFIQGKQSATLNLLKLAERLTPQNEKNELVRRPVYRIEQDPLVRPAMVMDSPDDLRVEPDRKAEVRRALRHQPATFDPIFARSHEEFQITELLFGTLVHVDASGHFNLNKDLVERTLLRTDPLVSTLLLRKNLTWHDGTPLTAEDIVFSWDQIPADDLVRIDLSKVVALDERRVEFHHSEPVANPIWDYDFSLIPQHVFDELAVNHPSATDQRLHELFGANPVGNGPYRLVQSPSVGEIILERWENYPGDQPPIQRVIFRVIEDRGDRIQALANGDMDVVELSPSEFTWDANGSSFDQHTVKTRSSRWNYDYICWNRDLSLFKDVKIRRAIALATDLQDLISQRYGIKYDMATGIFHPQSWMFNKQIHRLEYDPTRANALLDKAGWAMGDDGVRHKGDEQFRFRLLVPEESEETRILMFDLRTQLLHVGIDLRFDVQPYGQCLKKMAAHEFEAFLGSVLDPSHPDSTRRRWMNGGTTNYAHYSDPLVDRLYLEARREPNANIRKDDYRQIQRRIYEAQPYLFLWHRPALFAFSDRLHIVNLRSLGRTGIYPGPLAWWITRQTD